MAFSKLKSKLSDLAENNKVKDPDPTAADPAEDIEGDEDEPTPKGALKGTGNTASPTKTNTETG